MDLEDAGEILMIMGVCSLLCSWTAWWIALIIIVVGAALFTIHRTLPKGPK